MWNSAGVSANADQSRPAFRSAQLVIKIKPSFCQFCPKIPQCVGEQVVGP
jgi:hypothetical protein